MASNGSGRSGVLTAGGVLSIIAGALEVIGGGAMAILGIAMRMMFWPQLHPFYPGMWSDRLVGVHPIWFLIVGLAIFALGVVAIVGGVSAVRRGRFGLSLAGAICGLIPLNPLGLLAVIFVAVSKREFEASE